MNLLLYLIQNAFGRSLGQERNELSNKEWIRTYEKEYLESPKILRLIDRETPEYQNYDGIWIAGASRIGLMARIIDYSHRYYPNMILRNGETYVLAG
jgi:hypothetical protein